MLTGKRVLAIIDEAFEELELFYPKIRLEEESAVVIVSSIHEHPVHGRHGYSTKIDIPLNAVIESEFDALLLPGGFAPDRLRRLSTVKRIVCNMYNDGKLIAFICHGGWIPISAKILHGHSATGSLGIKDDLENAGVQWVDAPVVADGNIISSRSPEDLKYFARAIIDYLSSH
jgi:protease I